MDRKSLIISLIVSSILLFYLILDYYGVLRYFIVKNSDYKRYLKNYETLPKADAERVVIAFRYVPEQEKSIPLLPFINSILNQSVKVDDIILITPYKYMKSIPEYLKQIVALNCHSVDYEDASTIICSVLREPESNTKIIIVDSNMIYGKTFVQDLVEKSNDKPNSMVFGDKNHDLKYGVLIKPSFFDESIVDYKKGSGCKNWLMNTSKCEKCETECNGNFKLN